MLDWDAKLVVVFVRRSWPKETSPESLGWIYRHLVPGKPTVDVKFRAVVQPEDVTREDVEEWFAYLISGFERKFRPCEIMTREPDTPAPHHASPRLHRSVIDPV